MSRRKEIIKIRTELNDIRLKEQFKGSINPGACSLKKNTVDKPLTRLIKKKKREGPNK